MRMLKEHISHAENRYKQFTDLKRTKRQFGIGDLV